ncbi:hypothetical protein WAE56_04395 [Iodobacter sp. LRB]|nr:hypothetical protein [Iodobacter sp. BJB302]
MIAISGFIFNFLSGAADEKRDVAGASHQVKKKHIVLYTYGGLIDLKEN